MTDKETDYYGRMIDDASLLKHFEDGVMTVQEMQGYYKGMIVKYLNKYHVTNYQQDLDKAFAYMLRYKNYEAKINDQADSSHQEPQDGPVVIKQGINDEDH